LTAGRSARYARLPPSKGNPLAEPKQTEILQEIATAWETAKAQLERLKVQVARAAELANVKSKRDDLVGAKEKALRDLGAQAYELSRQGKLTLPSSASGALKAVEAANRQLEDQAREINRLLVEGEPERPRAASKGGANSAVAAKPKKR
jgi:hypothetical protein